MARERKKVHKVQMTDGKRAIIHQLLEEYDIETAEDIQDALKDLLGGTIKEMMEAEMDEHLGYSKSQRWVTYLHINFLLLFFHLPISYLVLDTFPNFSHYYTPY
jgi:hypothetical protein